MVTYEDSLLHILTLYNNTNCIPCLPLSPCTDNDCIWSHSFIFISLLGFHFVSWVIYYFVLLFWNGLMGLRNWCVGECVFVWESVCMYYSLLNVCVCEIVREEKKIGRVVLWHGVQYPMYISPLPVFIIVPVCSGVPLPLHPFIQMKEKEREMKRRRQRAFSLRGRTTQMRKDTFEKRIFFSSAGSQRRVYISKLIENDE